MNKPEVTKRGALDMQVCIPSNWINERVKSFADKENLCGTQYGWRVRKQGDKLLAGKNERVKCSRRKGSVHIMLDA